MATLTKDRIHLEGSVPVRPSRAGRVHVLGWQFGPVLMVVDSDLESALDEWDERHGTRVEPDDSALADYEPRDCHLRDAEGDVQRARMFAAMDDGDVRITSGGTMVWVDPYEWCRSFATVREAGAFWREC